MVVLRKIHSKKGKIVFILGAGFSKPAGAPNQKEIIEGIFGLDNPSDSKWEQFTKNREKLGGFIKEVFSNKTIHIYKVTL